MPSLDASRLLVGTSRMHIHTNLLFAIAVLAHWQTQVSVYVCLCVC